MKSPEAILQRMMLTIPEIRPSVIDRPLARRLEDLLKFRHVFRNSYMNPLDMEKMSMVQKAANGIVQDFGSHHLGFIEFLDQLHQHIEEL